MSASLLRWKDGVGYEKEETQEKSQSIEGLGGAVPGLEAYKSRQLRISSNLSAALPYCLDI